MHHLHWIRDMLSVGAILFGIVGGLIAYAPLGMQSDSFPLGAPSLIPSRSIATPALAPTPTETAPVSFLPLPNLTGLARFAESDAQGDFIFARYRNTDGVLIATFDPQDTLHTQGITWRWEIMTFAEKDQALRWIFDARRMRYANFENREDWVVNVVTKWIPKLTELSIPTDPRIASHWPADGPPMDQATIYEALSRIRSLTLFRERRMCSYGFSQLGRIEFGGEIVLFTAPGWKQVSLETREIVTAVWTIKEAMVIYYPQSQGWADSCPSESAHLKNEYYSTIWLVEAEQALSKLVPADASYWIGQEIPLQIRNIQTDNFPPCLPPARMPVLKTTSGSEGCTQIP